MSFAIPSLKLIIFESSVKYLELVPCNKGKTALTDEHFVRVVFKDGKTIDINKSEEALNVWNVYMAKINLQAQALNKMNSALIT